MFEFLENGSADDGGDGWICGILWNGNGLFLSDYPSRNPAADRLESDCAGLLPAGDAGGLYSLHSGGDHGKTAAPDGTGVSVERNEYDIKKDRQSECGVANGLSVFVS